LPNWQKSTILKSILLMLLKESIEEKRAEDARALQNFRSEEQ
jgi:hypothetical protein